MTEARSVLVVATGFPPLGGSGVQRTTKFVKYLPSFGWRSAVVTADPARDRRGELDESLLAEIPENTAILREPYWNPAASLLSRFATHRAPAKTFGTLTTPTELPAPGSVGLLRRCYRGLRRLLVAPVGDAYYYWSRRVRRRALDFARENTCAVIYVSASPFSSLLLGLWLKRKSGLPLVVDFRDPWTLFYPEMASGPRFRIDRHFERKVLAQADAVICNHQPMQADFERIEPRCRGKCEVITNGYDPVDFEAPPLPPQANTVVHVGIAWEDSPKPVLRALAALKDQAPGLEGAQVRFLGGLPASSLRLIDELQLESMVRVEPRTDHAEAIAAMRGAGVLLLLLVGTSAGSRWYPGKLFEYMASGRPIVCVAPKGIAGDLVRESGCGVWVDSADEERLRQILLGCLTDTHGFAERHCRPKEDFITRFDRKNLTARLAAVFDRLATGTTS